MQPFSATPAFDYDYDAGKLFADAFPGLEPSNQAEDTSSAGSLFGLSALPPQCGSSLRLDAETCNVDSLHSNLEVGLPASKSKDTSYY